MAFFRRQLAVAIVLPLLLGLFPVPAFASPDWDIPNGHFFTQTGGGTGLGFTVTDDDGVSFWSEFQRLGGVQAVGYPASERFSWDGFTDQVFQRVIFQWRPESQHVAFINTFDILDQLGKDDWLAESFQTPPPKQWDEDGMSWDQIVQDRLAVMDSHPAIRAAYFGVVGDAIQANGLPTSDIEDEGNHYALRAQRVEFQEWKVDVPWAKQGQVTVALGGDIAKQAGIIPDPGALQAIVSPSSEDTSNPATSFTDPLVAPSRLRIPSIGVDAPVITMGVKADGTMESPGDPYTVAWYSFSAFPGHHGNAVFAGHVDWHTGVLGVFYGIRTLQPGALIQVVDNGRTLTYAVTTSRLFSENETDINAVVGPTAGDVITLITCEGVFDPTTHSYNYRRMVRAALQNAG